MGRKNAIAIFFVGESANRPLGLHAKREQRGRGNPLLDTDEMPFDHTYEPLTNAIPIQEPAKLQVKRMLTVGPRRIRG